MATKAPPRAPQAPPPLAEVTPEAVAEPPQAEQPVMEPPPVVEPPPLEPPVVEPPPLDEDDGQGAPHDEGPDEVKDSAQDDATASAKDAEEFEPMDAPTFEPPVYEEATHMPPDGTVEVSRQRGPQGHPRVVEVREGDRVYSLDLQTGARRARKATPEDPVGGPLQVVAWQDAAPKLMKEIHVGAGRIELTRAAIRYVPGGPRDRSGGPRDRTSGPRDRTDEALG